MLAARDEMLDAALGNMMMDHVAHAADVAELVAICREIADEPEARPRLSEKLATVVQRLEDAFAQHLALEERVIFPAIRHLPQHYQLALRVAAQRRRARLTHATLARAGAHAQRLRSVVAGEPGHDVERRDDTDHAPARDHR